MISARHNTFKKGFKKVTCPFNNCLCIGPEYEGHAEVGRGEGEAAGG